MNITVDGASLDSNPRTLRNCQPKSFRGPHDELVELRPTADATASGEPRDDREMRFDRLLNRVAGPAAGALIVAGFAACLSRLTGLA